MAESESAGRSNGEKKDKWEEPSPPVVHARRDERSFGGERFSPLASASGAYKRALRKTPEGRAALGLRRGCI